MLLPSDYIALAGCILFGALLGLTMLRGPRWAKALAYTCAGLVWVVHVWHALREYPWVWLAPHTASAVLMYVAVWPPLIAVLFGLASQLKGPRDRRMLWLVSVAIGCYGGYTISMALLTPPVSTRSYWQGDVLMQTSDSTCIAAASATYLRTLGIESDELTNCRRGLIGREGGRTAQAWRIVRLSVPADWRVRIGPAGREEFADGQWRIAAKKIVFNIGHAIAVRMEPDGTLLIRDPMSGEERQSWEEFEQSYLGAAVWAEPPAR